MRKKKEKDYELEQDLFAISKANRRVMIAFLIIMLVLWCVPIYSLLKDSLKVHGIENYWYVLTNEVNGVPFYQYFVNSIINAVFASALLVLICSFSGFAFSKIEFAGRKVIYNLVLMCLAISGPILIIPFFYIYKTAHLYNTHLAIILSECLITIPFGVLMMKNFFDGLPTDAAGLDPDRKRHHPPDRHGVQLADLPEQYHDVHAGGRCEGSPCHRGAGWPCGSGAHCGGAAVHQCPDPCSGRFPRLYPAAGRGAVHPHHPAPLRTQGAEQRGLCLPDRGLHRYPCPDHPSAAVLYHLHRGLCAL